MPEQRLYANRTYEEIVEQYSDTVTRLCAIRCGNVEDTKDCYQTVFLKLFLSETEFESDEHIRAWLIRVSITTSLDYVKQFWHQNMFLYGNDKDTLNLIDTLNFRSQTVRSTTEESSVGAESAVAYEVFRLPLKYRQVIYLHYFEGYEVEEITAILGIASGTVKSQLSRGRKLLKKALEPQYSHEGGFLYEEK